jgi:large conductance mechanosensitive channel
VKALLKEFREFAMRGNVLDLAVGVIIGGAFNTVVRSLTTDILMPPIELLRAGEFADLYVILRPGAEPPPYASLAIAKEAGAVTLNFGAFVDALFVFVLTAIALFLVVRAINAAKRKEEKAPPQGPTTKKCPFCMSDLPIAATRCAFCTSHLQAEQEAPVEG